MNVMQVIADLEFYFWQLKRHEKTYLENTGCSAWFFKMLVSLLNIWKQLYDYFRQHAWWCKTTGFQTRWFQRLKCEFACGERLQDHILLPSASKQDIRGKTSFLFKINQSINQTNKHPNQKAPKYLSFNIIPV